MLLVLSAPLQISLLAYIPLTGILRSLLVSAQQNNSHQLYGVRVGHGSMRTKAWSFLAALTLKKTTPRLC